MADPDVIEISDRETAFSSHESDEDHLWDAIEILKERKGQYLIKWAGVDDNGKPWPDSWANKHDCTDDIVQAWKWKKVQKKKEAMQRKANKNLKARNSTVSEGSKASTSRQAASAGSSTRSLRSRTAIPGDRHDDMEKEYESISKTPRKRRLSTPVIVHDSDSSPPSPVRPAKKRRKFSESRQNGVPGLDKPKANAERSETPRLSPRKHTVLSDDEMEQPVVQYNGKGKPSTAQRRTESPSDDEIDRILQLEQPNGKGKAVDRPTAPLPAKPRGRPPKKSASLLQRHLEKQVDPDEDELSAKTPTRRSPLTTPPQPTPSDLFTLDRINGISQLSPNGQARLDQFDHDLAEKTPLFLPGSEHDSMSLSQALSRSQSRSRSPLSLAFAYPAWRLSSRLRLRAELEPPASPRQFTTHVRPPHAAQRTTLTASATSKASSSSLQRGPSLNPPLNPIPALTASNFRALTGPQRKFSSPEKGGKKARPLERRPLDVKGKRRARAEDDDVEDMHERVVARGVELAEAARAERLAKATEYRDGWRGNGNGKRTTLSEIREQQKQHQQQQQQQRGSSEARGQVVGVSMSTESDVPENGVKPSRHDDIDIEELRQEEEENTQDVMAFYQSADERDDDAASRAGGNSNPDDITTNRDADGDPSEPEDTARSIRDRSEDRETDPHYDIDVAERAAWTQEQSQQSLAMQDSANSPQPDILRDDDSMEVDLDGASIPAQVHSLNQERGSIVPASAPPAVPNGRLPKSRSTSARPRKQPADDTALELPPTASTRHNTPEAQSQSVPVDQDRDLQQQLDNAKMLLNAKSDENLRLEGMLADQRAMLVAEQAKNIVLQARVQTLETQSVVASTSASASASTGNDSDLLERLRVAEEALAAERAAQSGGQAAAEQQREVFQEYYMRASQFAEETGAANKELEKRVKIAEEQTKDGVAMMRATFELREVALKSETRDWRNQANFLREQAIRTNDDELRKRAAQYPEVLAKYKELVEQHEVAEERVECLEEDLRVKQDEIDRLEQQLGESNEELATLKEEKEKYVTGDTRVYLCAWRGEDNFTCPAFCKTQEDLNLHASMHVTRALVDPSLQYGSQLSQ
ncbi:Chromo domain-containing protein [Mycena venus]|uniref:Chromo domain-containing protein n=1 Tax=Mycena venus TaxID=2733690 RepID=A0A8H6Z2E1_9AGAR|nr:Chromo domain-containing protein [Mycena venus]